MPDHANVRFRDPEKAGGFTGRLLVVEGHHDDRTFALVERLNASSQLTIVEPGHRRRIRHEIASECRQQLFLPSRGAPKVEYRHAARAQHEVGELVRLPQTSRSKRFEHLQEHVLHEVVRGGWRSQVPKTVKPDPRPHAAAEFSFCLTIAGRDARCKVGVAQPEIHRPPLYVCYEMAYGCYEMAPIDSRGSAPWTSMLYFAATSAIGAWCASLISTTNRSKPPGEQRSSKRAGASP